MKLQFIKPNLLFHKPSPYLRLCTQYSTFSKIMAAPDPSSATTTAPQAQDKSTYSPRYIDIGINLTDPVFRGRYHGRKVHDDDLHAVVERSIAVGCTKLIITGTSLKSSSEALQLCSKFPGTAFSTAGIHPCSSSVFSKSKGKKFDLDDGSGNQPEWTNRRDDQDELDDKLTSDIIGRLQALIEKARSSPETGGRLVAFGEFGLDYDRLHWTSKKVQRHAFAAQLKLAASLKPQLPLFLHTRASHVDFVRCLKDAFGERLEKLEKGGVVHSFTGTIEEMKELIDLGLYIGINGCSLKTEENCALVKELDLEYIMLETDGPWCEVRPSHEGFKYLSGSNATKGLKEGKNERMHGSAGYKSVKKEKWVEDAMVKGRNEPCNIDKIGEIVAAIKGVSLEEVCEAAWRNTMKVFPLNNIKP